MPGRQASTRQLGGEWVGPRAGPVEMGAGPGSLAGSAPQERHSLGVRGLGAPAAPWATSPLSRRLLAQS